MGNFAASKLKTELKLSISVCLFNAYWSWWTGLCTPK
ncbi:hypothetical protein PHMEG_00021263 [Phytophthora megakarya]|uniref:Uncharacterized protein n=1 Tax=Phytophthora megakarya TaxID=4795 RepID=A0A225VM99_9STRA|nr:hypothetical protein PHMEG_00021263 [Phytophthora megakarya]